MEGFFGFSIRQMIVTSITAVILGLVMLGYPGGTVALMAGAFWSLQLVFTLFMIIYILSEIVRNAKAGKTWSMIVSVILGGLAIAFVWIFNVGFIYLIAACFFIVSGITEVIGSFSSAYGKFFIFLLGAVNIMIGVVLLKYPVILPLLIAWYILFWGVSRLMLALELRRLLNKA